MRTVAVLLNAQNLTQTYGAARLFQNINLNVSEGDRLGLIGPNGSGKSTLLQILAGQKEPDSGEVALRKNTRVAFVTQESQFEAGQSVRSIIRRALERSAVPLSERLARESETLGRVGFTELDAEANSLSGGWRKRLAIAEALTTDPDLLLLDEPTNHLDLAGIEWLEKFLQNTRFASVVVSHDRYFLENVATSMAELNRVYPDGIFQVSGNYSTFLEKKEEFLEAQNKRQDALANRVRTEIQWLRRGPKARATKAKARIDRAHEMIGELNDLRSRSTTANADFDFTATDRRTKRLMELKGVSYSYGTRAVLTDFSFVLTAGTRVGLVGPNGSGKTTLLRLLRGELQPQGGEIRRADNLRIVYFDQNRVLDPDLTLRQSLAPDGDSVVYQERTIHVASWAARFLFPSDQLNQPVGRLSGGERARILIAKLMLEPADVLLLDEPTNDLDIPTLEILEESLSEFKGALVLVTHDRYMLDRISTLVIGLDGEGAAGTFADYSQWETWQLERKRPKQKAPQAIAPEPALNASSSNKKKLSYLDNRDFETIEARITDAEKLLSEKQALLEDPSVVVNPERLKQALEGVESAQHAVDLLYTRWAELEAKIS